ncbi:MAG: hypothetical protein IJF33_07055 [Clostridia bacterium]|nr:hypothetical protein [Clostridia bacterium]
MLTLLIKDFKLMFSGGKGGRFSRILRLLLSVLFIGFFIGIEVFLFSAILDRIEKFNDARVAFIRLFLLVLSIFMTVSGVFRAKKLFFNEKDIQQLANHPVENSKLIFSKMFFLVMIHFATALMFEYPVFVAYGLALQKSVWFYYKALFYPLLASIFELGIALIFVYPVWMFLQYLKKHVVLEFSLAVLLIFSLAIPYSRLLNVFVSLVSNNELTQLFTEESIASIRAIGEGAMPLNLLADAFVVDRTSKLFSYLTFAGGVFVFGLSLTVFTFHYVRNMSVTSKPIKKKPKFQKRSQLYGLIKKEILLLTKNPDYIFSFSGLLFVQPFLLYLIVTAMNAIFSSGTLLYFSTVLFPNFVPLMDVFLVIMVTLIINSGANRYIAIEERTIKNLKTIPVSYRTQLIVKLLIPFTLSAIFLLISVAVLLISGVTTFSNALFSILLTLVVLFVFDVVSMREELHIRHGKPRSTFLSSLISYVLPFSYIALVMALSRNGFSLPMMYLAGVALFVLLGFYPLLNVVRRMGEWFMELEAIN